MSGDVIPKQTPTPLVRRAVRLRVGVERRLTSLRSNHSPRRIILYGGLQLAVNRGHGNSRSVVSGCGTALSLGRPPIAPFTHFQTKLTRKDKRRGANYMTLSLPARKGLTWT